MSSNANKSIYSPITYTPNKDIILFSLLVLITLFYTWAFKYWLSLAFNIIMAGYFIFQEMRLAIIFYAIIIRAIMYPFGLFRKNLAQKTDQAEEELKIDVKSEIHPVSKDKARRSWLRKYKKILIFEWFSFGFYTINALTVGWIFLRDFKPEIISAEIWTKILMPSFPLNTIGYIPLVGVVDLTKVNMKLNLYSAIGAGIVGFAEIIMHGKTSRKQLFMYLVMFPLGAFFLTMWVPSGFEFGLVVIELLTVLIIIAEKMVEFSQKTFSPPKVEEKPKLIKKKYIEVEVEVDENGEEIKK